VVTRARRAAAAAAALLAVDAFARAADATVEKMTVVSREAERTAYVFVPSTLSADRPAPMIVTLHGSGRNGRTLVDEWKGLAEKEGIVLAGPDSTDAAHWASPQDGPLLLKDVVDAVAARHAIDGRRVYLFGHSAGAVFALQMACLESEYFAAAAVHAGAVDPKYFNVFDYAARKIPIAIWIGTKDRFFPLASVRATAEALKSRGFPVALTELPNHTHDYYSDSRNLNPEIWKFLSAQKLAEEPRFRKYADPR
jgi:poly(3-hydroxybutyrate) depolymerase